MDGSLLLLFTTIVPVLLGIICYFVPGYNLKKYIVILCALVLSVASLLVLYGGPQKLAVESIDAAGVSIPISPIILLFDFLLLVTLLYFGLKDKEYKAVGLVILQAIPLAYLEFFMPKASHVGAATFVFDDLAIVMCLIVSLIGSLILIYSIGYMKGGKNVSSFFLIMMLFLGDMNALIFTNDLTWLFFFWEVTTLCSFLLIRHYRNEESIKASDRALWMNLLGGVGLITGIVLIRVHVRHYNTLRPFVHEGHDAGIPFIPARSEPSCCRSRYSRSGLSPSPRSCHSTRGSRARWWPRPRCRRSYIPRQW